LQFRARPENQGKPEDDGENCPDPAIQTNAGDERPSNRSDQSLDETAISPYKWLTTTNCNVWMPADPRQDEIEICRSIDVLVPGRKTADMKGAGARNEAGKSGILREEPCVDEPARYCSASALACQQSGRCHHNPNAIVIWLS